MTTKARIRLSGVDINQLNEICSQIKYIAGESKVDYAGPIPLPTKILKIPTRKSVSGNGTATWERWQMRIHKRVLDVEPNDRVMRQVMRLQVPDGVNIEIEIKS
ncbi:MAG: 30S ribosomal protein S10 [archaeon]